MSAHPGEDRLFELVDGTLSASEQASIEAHIAACDECRAGLAALRAFIDELHALPRAIAPQRDLRADMWAQIDVLADTDAISEAVDAPRAVGLHADLRPSSVSAATEAAGDAAAAAFVLPRRPAARTLASSKAWLAAAAVALIAVSSAVTWLIVRRAQPGADVVAANGPATAPATAAEVQALQARYVLATRELEQLLDAQRAQLPPETLGILEENLRIIDRALAEAAAALAGQPGNADLSRILVATWEKKLGLLRTATALEVGI